MEHVWIYQPAKAATQSGLYRPSAWVMQFAPKDPKMVDISMGWIGSDDTLEHHKIFFDTKEDAVSFAEKEKYVFTLITTAPPTRQPKNYSDNFLRLREVL